MFLRRIYRWRALRRIRKGKYRLDKRHYRRGMGPGFFVFLTGSRFWDTNNDPLRHRGRWKRRVLAVLWIILGAALAWVVWESLRVSDMF